jgi:hypothetical protein
MQLHNLTHKHNKLVSKLYNPAESYDLARRVVNEAGKDAVARWKADPLTIALKMTLVGDLSNIVATVLTGGYNSENSVDATAQRVAEAQGKAAALQDIIDHIDSLQVEIYDEENTPKE